MNAAWLAANTVHLPPGSAIGKSCFSPRECHPYHLIRSLQRTTFTERCFFSRGRPEWVFSFCWWSGLMGTIFAAMTLLGREYPGWSLTLTRASKMSNWLCMARIVLRIILFFFHLKLQFPTNISSRTLFLSSCFFFTSIFFKTLTSKMSGWLWG